VSESARPGRRPLGRPATFALGVAAASLPPIVGGVLVSRHLLPGDSFWIAAPFGLIPLSGVLAGLAARRAGLKGSPIGAALSVPVGVGLGWVVAMLVSLPLDASQESAQTLFFALLSTFVLPWWVGPLLLAMGIAWFVGRNRWGGRPGEV